MTIFGTNNGKDWFLKEVGELDNEVCFHYSLLNYNKWDAKRLNSARKGLEARMPPIPTSIYPMC